MIHQGKTIIRLLKTLNIFFMKGKYIDTQILLAALSGGGKKKRKLAA